MMIIPSIFFFLFIIAYVGVTAMVWWHLKEHASPHDPYNRVSFAFLIAIILFLALSIFLFFRINWEEILLSLGDIFYVPIGR